MTNSGMGREWGLAVMLAVALAGCGRQPTETELIASAKKSLDEGKTPAAIIQIRNALQLNANSAEARFLMGQALFANGDAGAAEGEYRRARAAGLPDVKVVPPLARMMLLLDQPKKVVEEFAALKFDDKAADADLSFSLAMAYGRLRDAAAMEQQFARSQQGNPDYPPALLFKVRRILQKQGADAALQELQSHRDALAKDAEAAYLEGSIKLNVKQDVDGAIEAFKRSVSLEPKALASHEALVAVYLYKKDLAAAGKQVEAMVQAQPKSAVARTYQAELALVAGDLQKARTVAYQVLEVAPDYTRALYIAASADLQLKNVVQAVALLQKALSQQPNLTEASKLLARAYLQSGQAPLALKAVERPLERSPRDGQLLTLAAEAQMQMGESQKAEALYKQVLALKPDDAGAKTALAMVTLAKGQESEGLSQLAAVAQQDSSPVPDMLLISSYMSRGQLDRALEATAALDRKQPDKASAPFSRGRILTLKGDSAGARAAFEEALKRDASYIPAMNNLAVLDLREGKNEAARGRFEAILKSNPGNVGALMSLADVLAVQKAPPAEVVALLERATAAEPSAPAPHLMLVEYLLLQQNYAAAVTAGQKAMAAVSPNPELLNALGRAQSAVGDNAQAQASFAKQAQLQPKATGPYLSAAEAYRRAGDRANAVRSLKQALSLNPQFLPAQEVLFGMELRAEHFPAALDIARDVQKQRPLLDRGYQWEGEVHLVQKHWDQAIAAYKRGIDKLREGKQEAYSLASLQHRALLRAKRDADAERFAQEWLKGNPRDIGFRLYLGDVSMLRQDWEKAEQQYRSVLDINPNQALAANNVAAMLMRLKRPGAVEMAERAVKLAPTSPDALDTLAMALADEKQWDKALDAERKAVGLAPASSELKLKMARLLIDAGKKADAEAQLKALQALGGKFDRQAEVSTLLKKL